MKNIVWVALLFGIPIALMGQSPIYVVLRIDDIQSRNTSYLPKNLSAFEQAAESRGAKVTYVTIPHRLLESGVNNGTLTAELKNSLLHGHEIAQHGYNHICTRCGSTGHEMYCDTQKSAVGRSVQDSLIKSGMKVLNDSLGIVPSLFVSPGHFEDSTTYHLLAEHRFTNISTTKSLRGEVTPGVFNIPSTKEYTWAMTGSNYRSQFTAGMNDVRTIGQESGCFVFLFHDPFTRQGYLNGIVISWMGEMLDSLKAEYGDRIKYVTLSEAAEHFKSPTTVRSNISAVPEEMSLGQNYPNPFNPSTTIEYNIAPQTESGSAGGVVQLSVYDVLGNVVATVVNGSQKPGKYSAQFNASSLASGIYFYRLQFGTNVAVRKMVLMK
ncbi:MAG: DUF2334 domain-containing protein [Bacteroidota bacterium]